MTGSRILIDSPVTPDALPAVAPGDLMRAWDAATVAAEMGLQAAWDDAAGVTFRGPGGEVTLLFEDMDARVWVAGINRLVGLDTAHGIALCFRLLALIELMATAAWSRPLFTLGGADGPDIHPALFRVAASMPLGRDARFDSREFERRTRTLTGPARLRGPQQP
ncbi:hypothetical protein [Caenispirillum bisanense]|uniref:hypothetical protein n=1 Tax=Caenispirillum bisanense TaxID=414052 RepID=UPI0031DB4BCA